MEHVTVQKTALLVPTIAVVLQDILAQMMFA